VIIAPRADENADAHECLPRACSVPVLGGHRQIGNRLTRSSWSATKMMITANRSLPFLRMSRSRTLQSALKYVVSDMMSSIPLFILAYEEDIARCGMGD
jgi:hypothetical protein